LFRKYIGEVKLLLQITMCIFRKAMCFVLCRIEGVRVVSIVVCQLRSTFYLESVVSPDAYSRFLLWSHRTAK